jgi:hypothetical protein
MGNNISTYQQKINNAKILMNALLKGEIELKREMWNGKEIAIYVPKNKSKRRRSERLQNI